jgi:hypothetical protein
MDRRTRDEGELSLRPLNRSEASWIGSGPEWSCADNRSSCGTCAGCKMSDMDVELLIVPDCPNESLALSVLRLALDRVGLAAHPVRISVIASRQQVEEREFVDSPTILVDGVDPFGVAGQSGFCLPRLCHPGRPVGCAGVGRPHLRPDRRP